MRGHTQISARTCEYTGRWKDTRTQAITGMGGRIQHRHRRTSLCHLGWHLPSLRAPWAPGAGPDSDQDFPQLVLLAVRRLLPEAFSGWLGEKTRYETVMASAAPLVAVGLGDPWGAPAGASGLRNGGGGLGPALVPSTPVQALCLDGDGGALTQHDQRGWGPC